MIIEDILLIDILRIGTAAEEVDGLIEREISALDVGSEVSLLREGSGQVGGHFEAVGIKGRVGEESFLAEYFAGGDDPAGGNEPDRFAGDAEEREHGCMTQAPVQELGPEGIDGNSKAMCR